MSETVNLPALGESVTEGTVTRWLKAVGDEVAVDEPLVEVSTDKVDTEIPSPVAGVLEEILVEEDDTVEVGAPLATIGDGSGGGSADASEDDAAAEEPAVEEAQQDDAQQEPAGEPAPEERASTDQGSDEAPSAGGEASEVTLPALGESVTEGTVTRWLKSVGDEVEVDEPLLEVSTDKVDTEVPSPVAGIVQAHLAEEDETVEVGAVLALAKGGAPVDVVAVAALAENMPDGNAIRPADVLTAMNGKTIEIISTDAEGRLVLADAVVWADTTLNPAAIVDVATLTGSVGGALGNDYAGLFSRHDALADQLKTAGDATGETLWRLPLHPSYVRATSSTIADIKNSGDGGAGAGTGAHFIGYFARPETPWAHLDIANMAFGGASDVKPAGSAGYSVRLLERFVRDFQPVAKEKGTGGY